MFGLNKTIRVLANTHGRSYIGTPSKQILCECDSFTLSYEKQPETQNVLFCLSGEKNPKDLLCKFRPVDAKEEELSLQFSENTNWSTDRQFTAQ